MLGKPRIFSALVGFLAATFIAVSAQAQSFDNQSASESGRYSYADLVGLADDSQLVIRAQIRKQIVLEPERSPGLQPGFVRLYIEARTLALLSGSVPIGESLRYLVDVPLNPKGKPPKLKKTEVILFARGGRSGSGDVQLVNSRLGQQPYSAGLEARLRPILAELVAPDAPPVVTGINDALSVAGNLAGESETQIFLATQDGSPVSISILRRPNRAPVWGVSWGEIIDQAARAPRSETLRWYRLACALPASLPSSANLSRESTRRMQAQRDYRFVIGALGPCERRISG